MAALANDIIVDVNLITFSSVDSGVDKKERERCQLVMHCYRLPENLSLSRPAREGAILFVPGREGRTYT